MTSYVLLDLDLEDSLSTCMMQIDPTSSFMAQSYLIDKCQD